MLLEFGSGDMWGVGPAANATPVKFGVLQSAQLDFQMSQKELYGQAVYPVAVGNSQGKISGKIKFANIDGNLFNSLFFNSTLAVGSVIVASAEPITVPAASPWTVVVANGSTFVQDLGVTNAASGIPLTKVASAPATGQYSVAPATGTYTFAAADTGIKLLVDYTYSSATAGKSVIVSNPLQGQAPIFQAVLRNGYNSLFNNMILYACVSQKLALASKTADWVVPELDFAAFANAAGNTHQFNFAQ